MENSIKYCGICGKKLKDFEKAYRGADGILTISFIKLDGINYILCPSCTRDLDMFIKESREKERKSGKILSLKKENKIIDINDYRKKRF